MDKLLFVEIEATNPRMEKTFVGIASIPQDFEAHEVGLSTEWEDEPIETLRVRVNWGLHGLRVCIEKLSFLLIRKDDFFTVIATPQDISNHWKFTKSDWRIGARLTTSTNNAMVYGLIRQHPGLTATELKKLFGLPICRTLKRMSERGWIRREPTGTRRYRYYLLK